MSRKVPFTDEQISILEKNIYTYSVTPGMLSFTLEFKEFFVEQVKKGGKTTAMILSEAGYDASLFPKSCRNSLRRRILREAASDTGLKPPKGISTEERIAAFEAKDLANQKTEASIREMQERIVQLEKQVEFLKKILQTYK